MKKHVVLLNGSPRAGKDTVADVLCREFNFEELKFAEPLRSAVTIKFDLDGEIFDDVKDDEDYGGAGKTPRQWMQWLSEDVIKTHPGAGPAFFGITAALRAAEILKYKSVVVSDCGFQQEACAFIDMLCGPLVRVVGPPPFHLVRILRPLDPENGVVGWEHDTREPISELPRCSSHIIFNSSGLKDLTEQARVLGEQIKHGGSFKPRQEIE